MLRVLLLIPVLFAISACATPQARIPTLDPILVQREREEQEDLALSRLTETAQRLDDISYPVLHANTDFCNDNTTYTLGMRFETINHVEKHLRGAARRMWRFDDRFRVIGVTKGGPAARARLLPGDIIVQIQGVSPTRRLDEQIDQYLRRYGDVPLRIERAGRPYLVFLAGAKVCGYDVKYLDSPEINAFADGANIIISRGMIRFVESEDELALVVAHELAHNVRSHIGAKTKNALVAALGGLLVDRLLAAAGVNTEGAFAETSMSAGAQAFSVEFEQEADYLGMYFIERAGYDSTGVANLWRRMAIENNARGIAHATTHPTTPERFVGIEATRAEIAGKRRMNRPLVPEWKHDTVSNMAKAPVSGNEPRQTQSSAWRTDSSTRQSSGHRQIADKIQVHCTSKWQADLQHQQACVKRMHDGWQEVGKALALYPPDSEEYHMMSSCWNQWLPQMDRVANCTTDQLAAFHAQGSRNPVPASAVGR